MHSMLKFLHTCALKSSVISPLGVHDIFIATVADSINACNIEKLITDPLRLIEVNTKFSDHQAAYKSTKIESFILHEIESS